MLRYFMAEGIASGHALHVISQDCSPQSLVKNLPAVISEELPLQDKTDDNLTIAWRYKNMKTVESEHLSFAHKFDLTKVMSQSVINDADISYWNCKGDYKSGKY